MAGTRAACIANIGPEGRRKRFRVAIIAFGIGAAIAVILAFTYLAPAWRLFLFGPFWVAALGFFQARDKTCVRLASRGQRDLDQGPEPIGNVGEMKQLRRQARAVHNKSLIAAGGLTLLTLFL